MPSRLVLATLGLAACAGLVLLRALDRGLPGVIVPIALILAVLVVAVSTPRFEQRIDTLRPALAVVALVLTAATVGIGVATVLSEDADHPVSMALCSLGFVVVGSVVSLRVWRIASRLRAMRDDLERDRATLQGVVTGQRHIERMLIDREATLATAQEVAGFGSFVLTLDHWQYTWSDALCALCQFPPGTRPTTGEALRLVHPDDRAYVVEHHQAVAESHQDASTEFRVCLPTGRVRLFKAASRYEPADEERPARLIGAVTDITELRTAAHEHERRSGAERIIGDAARRLLAADRSEDARLDELAHAVTQYLGAGATGIHQVERDVVSLVAAFPPVEDFPIDRVAHVALETLEVFLGSGTVLHRRGDQQGDPRLDAFLGEVGGDANVMIPVRVDGRLVALIGSWWLEGVPDDVEERLRLLRPLADVLGGAFERLRARAALDASEARLRRAFEHTPVGLAMLSPELELRTVNPALERMLGRAAADCVGRSLLDLVPEDQHGPLRTLADDARAGFVDEGRWEHQLRRPDESSSWVQAEVSAIRDPDGQLRELVGQFTDVTARKSLEAQLALEATHDSLTGLPNRKLLLDRIRIALAQAGRRSATVALLFLDLDRFKLVNDTHGHAAGDELLVEIGRRLVGVVREGDTVARLGGDEFVVLCADVADEAEARAIAKRVTYVVEQVVELSRGAVFVGSSIGIALAPGGLVGPEELMRRADVAVYGAKERGRGRIDVYDAVMHAASEARLTTEVELRAALDHGEIRAYFQPVVGLYTHHIVGFEALARWHHPQRGCISPEEFIGVAEETGLVVALGREMLDQACRELARWKEGGLLPPEGFVSVNIAARHVNDALLTESVAEVLERYHREPAELCLEITETAVMADIEHAIAVLQDLRALGVNLAIDDFGTGQSSLTYLRRLPIDAVKVDQSFTFELGTEASGATIVAAVVELAHALGLRVVAEGVERPEHLDALLDLGCDSAQGYLFAPPMPADEVVPFLLDRQGRLGP